MNKVNASLLAAALAVAGVIAPAQAQTPRDTIVMARQLDDFKTFDPAEQFEVVVSEPVANVYDTLMTFDSKDSSKILGGLAQSWSVEPDGKTYTFNLRKGLKFHSGNPITAQDVVWSFQRVVALNKTPAFILTQLGWTKDNVKDRVRAVDDHTVVLFVDKPFAPTFVYYVLKSPVAAVLDSKLVMPNEKDGDWGNAWLNANSAGSGPYRLRSWRASEGYVLEANKTYWGGAPKNNRVIFRHVPEPAAQRLLLEKGDIDVARDINKDQLAALEANKDIRVLRNPQGLLLYMAMNQRNANLAKPEVREAIKYLIDYQSIERNILSGFFSTHQAFLPAGFLGALKDKPFKLDVERAKSLLARAGLPNGFSVTLDVRNSYPSQDVAQAVQASLAQGGIKAELITGEGRQVLAKFRERRFDLVIAQWGPDYMDPHTNAYTFAMNEDNSDNASKKTLAWRAAWEIPQMTQRTQAAVYERDAKKREAMYLEIQREHQRTSPFAVMFQKTDVIPHRANVSGFVTGPSSSEYYYKDMVKR